MASINLIDPYSQQAEEIARRQRMAQALQESGSQILPMPTTPGVAISPYAGLAKILESGYGSYQEKKARQDYANLQNEYRTNYNTQLGELARLISAPEVKGVAGQQAIEPQASVQEPIYATKPENLTAYGSGMGTQQDKDKILGWETTVPRIAGQPAIAPVEAQPAGYISPKALQGFDIPEVKALAMAKYLAQFEPKDVKLGAGDVLYRQMGANGQLIPVATAASTPQRPIALPPGHELRGPTGNLLATAAEKTTSTTPSKLAQLQAEYDAIAAKDKNDPRLEIWKNAIANEVKNVAAERLAWDQKVQEAKDKAPNYTYKEEIDPTTGVKSLIKIDNTGVASEVLNSAGTKVKTEIPKTPAHYSEIEDKGNIVIVDMSLPADQRLAKGQIKGPIRGNLKQIETNDAEGRPVTRWVDESTLAALGDIPKQYTGLLLEMAQAGQLKKGWESDPRVAGVIRDNLINQSGGITPAKLAELRVRIAESAAKLAYEGVSGFSVKDLTPSLSNLTTLPSGSSAPAPAAALKITTRAEIADAAKRSGKSIDEVTRDAVAKGFKVQ